MACVVVEIGMAERKVSDIVEAVVREQFPNSAIQSVQVASDVDDEGDTILKILVLLDGDFNKVDNAKILGLVRHIRSELSSSNENGFPIVNFLSSADAVKMRREVA